MNELLEKINQTFDNSINTSNEDTALQLRILKGNINTLFKEAMEGDIQNNSNEYIPVVDEVIVTSENISANKKILIVDDSSIIRNYLQKAISGKYDTLLVTGGQEAIDTIPNKNIDLILLDLMMPGIDGFGVLDYLKDNNITIPVVIISGDTTKETIDRAFTYNVVDMIEKPFSEKVIMDKINRILD